RRGERRHLGVERGGREGVRAAAHTVGTEDAALGHRDETLRLVAVAAAEGAAPEAREELPAAGVHALPLEGDEELGDVAGQGPHCAGPFSTRRGAPPPDRRRWCPWVRCGGGPRSRRAAGGCRSRRARPPGRSRAPCAARRRAASARPARAACPPSGSTTISAA